MRGEDHYHSGKHAWVPEADRYGRPTSRCLGSPLVNDLLIPPLHEVAHLRGTRQDRRRDFPHSARLLLRKFVGVATVIVADVDVMR